MRSPFARAAAVAAAALLCLGAASDPDERLRDPGQEGRARHLFQSFRCVVCQNESIDDSDADLARDLRRIIRGQIAAGRSDAEIRAFLVERYGEFVLLQPSFSPGNAALWLTPLAVLAGAALYLFAQGRKPLRGERALTEDEEAKLAALSEPGPAAKVPPNKSRTNGRKA